MTTSQTIAAEILQQLGGQKFIVMTGSKNFSCDGNSLNMHLIPNKSKAKYLTITLNSMDTYDLVFFTVDKNFNRIIKAEINGIYNDMLQSSFTQATGLITKLF